jgi:hypothetical protein
MGAEVTTGSSINDTMDFASSWKVHMHLKQFWQIAQPEILETKRQIYDVRIDNLKEPIWSINLK